MHEGSKSLEGHTRRGEEGAEMSEDNPVEKILEQMQKENFSHAPGEEMTHVAGVSFVDDVGLSLGGTDSTSLRSSLPICICLECVHVPLLTSSFSLD